MEWQTKISPKKEIEFSYTDNILFIGSCFAENMGEKFVRYGFSSLVNPFGILFNPISIANCLDRCLKNQPITDEELVFHHNLWHSYLHHGDFSRTEKECCINDCNESIVSTNSFLENTNVLIITLGTAFVYYTKNGIPVANCHKIPNTEFAKKLCKVEEIVSCYKKLIDDVLKINPEIKILFTVSPVRHWKDGYRENQVSKSTLHLAIQELEEAFPFVYYFPSYEIVMDELRDYRFYAEDMLHLTKIAIDYIWEKFSDTYFSQETNAIISDMEKYRKMEEHRSINKEFEENHLKNLAVLKDNLLKKYPFLKIS